MKFQGKIDEIRKFILSDASLCAAFSRINIGRWAEWGRSKTGEEIIEILLHEAALSLGLIEGFIEKDTRILEIGGGAGIGHAVLQMSGYDIVSIEPSLAGHDPYYSLGRELIGKLKLDVSRWLPLSCYDLESHARVYDLIFSNNVLEHVSDLPKALGVMERRLAPAGCMRHNTPNYLVPYEPHFSIPLVPFFHQWTVLFYPRIKNDELWKGLNFISSRDVVRIASKLGLSVAFDGGHFAHTLSRLDDEPLFRSKHKMAASIYGFFKSCGAAGLFRHLPGYLTTPIQFTMKRRGARAA